METLLAVLLGLLAGGLLGYLVGRLRLQRTLAETVRLETELREVRARRDELRDDFAATSDALGETRATLARSEARLAERDRANEAQLAELKDLHARFQHTFKALSADALKASNTQFLELARETLGTFQEGAQGDLSKRQEAIHNLVKPLQEALQKVDGKIGEIEKAREGAYAGLREQLRSLAATQSQLQGETANLVQALRTPNVRGQWGEVQLEKTVRFAGMVEHVDFIQQESATTEEERRLRPDLIVRLPNGNQIVVDAKTPLDGYLQALATSDPVERQRQITRHARQIRDHIRKLGSKQYWKQFEPSPEFVVLFIPGEAFFSAALEEDPSLIEAGTAENVILATPTTLIALLKAVAFGWRQEQIAAQAQAISDLGRELYERLATVGSHFEKLGKTLDRSVEHYNAAMRSLDTRVFVTARKFQDLAPLSDKELPTLPGIERAVHPPANPEWSEAESSASSGP
ncbi:MAG: DNA recombination protein RmuC [Opitutales bacterium]